MTSVADRTSPVLRGKCVLEVLLGMPPPPPPPNVPDFEETRAAHGSQLLSVIVAPLGNGVLIADPLIFDREAPGPLRPGDVVLAKREGIMFIPAHLAEEVVRQSEEISLRDRFSHQRLREGR